MIRLITLLLLVVIPKLLMGSDSTCYKSRWQIRTGVGYSISSPNLEQGYLSDDLIGYQSQAVNFNLLSISYFFNKRLGIEINYHLMLLTDNDKKQEAFYEKIDDIYGSAYFTSFSSKQYGIHGGTFERYSIGLVYRIESRKWIIYPKAHIGSFSFRANTEIIDLKQKQGNVYAQSVFSVTDNAAQEYLTFTASSTIGYKLNKRFYAAADFSLFWTQINFDYINTLTNFFTQEAVTHVYPYRSNVFSGYAQLGIVYMLHFKR